MKTLFISILFISLGLSMNAQGEEKKQSEHNKKNVIASERTVIVLINNEIIGNPSILKNIPQENLATADFSEDAKLGSKKIFSAELMRQELLNPELKNGGIIKLETALKFNIKTQKDLNTFFGLKESNDIFVNGYLLNKKYAIINECIREIQLIKEGNLFLKDKVLNIII
ncbi:hypothetical protein [Polaribacter sp. HaHaR_3_91]|jgi:hypothetical protein|uniref:hypothetical protein n=1 Tax=Polaribacter sp. HaHaR_3_91 TaxID=2745561 RepID=UPI001C4F10F1|nr:hypothetical protein [Polaribacter sp. HaHaR_3_91]QXP63662.1 hypothetical protein H0I27_00225 [Polaribacter sp. HaHaR_3_91]